MKNLYQSPIVFFIEPSLNIFFRIFYLAIEALYNDCAISSDGSVCRTLCDLYVRLDGSPSCEDSPITIMKKKIQSTFFYT